MYLSELRHMTKIFPIYIIRIILSLFRIVIYQILSTSAVINKRIKIPDHFPDSTALIYLSQSVCCSNFLHTSKSFLTVALTSTFPKTKEECHGDNLHYIIFQEIKTNWCHTFQISHSLFICNVCFSGPPKILTSSFFLKAEQSVGLQ